MAGRIAIQTLLPLSIDELPEAKWRPQDLFTVLFEGFYPSLYARKLDPNDWHKGYIQTYVERDVRQIQNVSGLSVFQKFLKLCAGRIGQLLDLTSLSNDCGISVGTMRGWLSILEASYIVFLLQPHFKNFSKRLIKLPKLYFYGPGLACHLLGIESRDMLISHYSRGGLFESMVLIDLVKMQAKFQVFIFGAIKRGLKSIASSKKRMSSFRSKSNRRKQSILSFSKLYINIASSLEYLQLPAILYMEAMKTKNDKMGMLLAGKHLSEIPE